MRFLPSEAAEKVKAALAEWNASGALDICEPCNCGSHIRHNNGGNYHQRVFLRRDSGRVFVKFDDTCTLTPPAKWKEITESEAVEIIDRSKDWL